MPGVRGATDSNNLQVGCHSGAAGTPRVSSPPMAKRRTSAPQRRTVEPGRGESVRRTRASEAALNQRLGSSGRRAPNLVLLGFGAFLAIGALAVAVALLIGGGGCDKYCGTRQPDEGRTHVQTGQIPSYRSVPATSGPHWNEAGLAPMNWGVYTTPVLEPAAVHNLEHGGIVIWYQPAKLGPADVKALTDYVRQQVTTERYKVILSPWSGKDFRHAIAVTAWDWLLYLDQPSTDAIRKFVDAHYDQGPEPAAGPGPPARQ